jgi:hypothetical protein
MTNTENLAANIKSSIGDDYEAAMKFFKLNEEGSTIALNCVRSALADAGESTEQQYTRSGALHRAANYVNARIRELGIPAGDWSWMAILEAYGVSREEVDAQYNAAKSA